MGAALILGLMLVLESLGEHTEDLEAEEAKAGLGPFCCCVCCDPTDWSDLELHVSVGKK